MCNVFNRCGSNCCGSTVNTANTANTAQTTGACSCGCWNGGWQRVCRDGCGNLIVRNVNTCNTCGCGCGNSCGCCHHTCCNSNGNGTGNNGNTAGNGNTNGNANGVFRCVTFCGYGVGQTNATQTNASQINNRFGCNCAAAYYARQYGLSCDDNGECSYNFTND